MSDFIEFYYSVIPGLKISTRKLAKCKWFFRSCESKKYPLANIC